MDMVTPVLNSILNFMFSIMQALLYVFLAVFIPVCVMLLGNFLYRLIFKRQKLPKRSKRPAFHYVEKFNPVKLIFWDFPMAMISLFVFLP